MDDCYRTKPRGVRLMPRIRTIKPDICEDETLGRVSRDARLTFILLWTRSDDHGRFRAAGALLKAQLFPYDLDVTPDMVSGWLQELAKEERIVVYEVDGQRYGVIPKWFRHQRIHNVAKQMLPAPPEWVQVESHPDNDEQEPSADSNKSRCDTNTGDDCPSEIPKSEDAQVKGTFRGNPRKSEALGENVLGIGKGEGIGEGKGTGKGKGKHLPREAVSEPSGDVPKVDGCFPTTNGFQLFWQTWPADRRAGQPETRRQWKAARNYATDIEIVEGLEVWLTYWELAGTPAQYIPKPANWLRNHTWMDIPPPIHNKTNGNGQHLFDVLDAFTAKEDEP